MMMIKTDISTIFMSSVCMGDNKKESSNKGPGYSIDRKNLLKGQEIPMGFHSQLFLQSYLTAGNRFCYSIEIPMGSP